MQSEYARLAGMSPAALTAAMEPYLPFARTLAQWIAQTRERPLRVHPTAIQFSTDLS
jgi:hypothetical protein